MKVQINRGKLKKKKKNINLQPQRPDPFRYKYKHKSTEWVVTVEKRGPFSVVEFIRVSLLFIPCWFESPWHA
jgi:hypothetical protein